MKILFDQGTPLPLQKWLGGHEVITAFRAGWSELANGDLLTAAESGGFDAIVHNRPELEVSTKCHRQTPCSDCPVIGALAGHRKASR